MYDITKTIIDDVIMHPTIAPFVTLLIVIGLVVEVVRTLTDTDDGERDDP
jgi:hypothetical protein